MTRTTFFSCRGSAFAALAFLCLSFVSCKKDDLNVDQPPAAALMAYNLVPDQAGVTFRLSGNPLPTGPLAYPGYSGRYLPIYTGARTVAVSGSGGQLMDSMTYAFEADKFYSAFIVGASNNYRLVVSHDNYDSLTASSGSAYVRYINALSNAGASTVTISAGGSNVVNVAAPYAQVSGFVAVNPGPVTVSVANESVAAVNRTITLDGRKAYTILLVGLPNQTDSAKSVQIRYIENGTVTD
jgi:hypothetical protein